MYDVIIIGAGPAGLTGAVYARRASKSVLVLEKGTFGGQITHSPKVENYPGFIEMSGNELGEKLIDQALFQGAEIELDKVVKIEKKGGVFTVTGESATYEGKSVIIATGSEHRKLSLPNEDKFTGEGISYCAVCDGAFYKGKDIAVIGGGNSALQEAILLSKGCKSVTLVQNLAFLTGEKQLAEIVNQSDNIGVIYNSVAAEILGEDKFEGIKIKNTENGEETVLTVDAVFVAIGQEPKNGDFASIVKLDERGYIICGEDCLPESEVDGIFIAGDCRTKKIRQVATAVSDGAIAALEACNYIDKL